MLYFRFPHPEAGSAAVTHFAKSAILGDSESLTEPILPRAPDTASYPQQDNRLKRSYQQGLAPLAVPQSSLGVTWPNLNGFGVQGPRTREPPYRTPPLYNRDYNLGSVDLGVGGVVLHKIGFGGKVAG